MFWKILTECYRSHPSSGKQTPLQLPLKPKQSRADWQVHAVRTPTGDTLHPSSCMAGEKDGGGTRVPLAILKLLIIFLKPEAHFHFSCMGPCKLYNWSQVKKHFSQGFPHMQGANRHFCHRAYGRELAGSPYSLGWDSVSLTWSLQTVLSCFTMGGQNSHLKGFPT